MLQQSIVTLSDVAWPSTFAVGIEMLSKRLADVEAAAAEKTNVDEEVLLAVLPIFDGIERANRMDGAMDPFRRRLLARVLQQIVDILERFGATPDRPLGAEFDPHVHDAVAVRDLSHVAPGTVIQLEERGWFFDTRLLRPSKVVVSRALELTPELGAHPRSPASLAFR